MVSPGVAFRELQIFTDLRGEVAVSFSILGANILEVIPYFVLSI